MLFHSYKNVTLDQPNTMDWKGQWQSIVPEENRNVPISFGGKTVKAYIQINHFVMMLQDGLLMDSKFFDVCSHFQRAGYRVIWLMRCTQDIANGYLRLKKETEESCVWNWRKPTTNFESWTSDNRYVTILLQYKQIPDGDLSDCQETILQRVQWTQSDDCTKLVPRRSQFQSTPNPGSPKQLRTWLHGGFLTESVGW